MMCQMCLKHKVTKLSLFACLFLSSYSAAATDLALRLFQVGKPSVESPAFQLSIEADNTSPINHGALNSPKTTVGFFGGLGATIVSIEDPEGQVTYDGNIIGITFYLGTVSKNSIYRFKVNLSKTDCGTESPYSIAGVVSGDRYDPDISNNSQGLLIVCEGDTVSPEVAGKILGPLDLLLSN